jgi:hypothetical protein
MSIELDIHECKLLRVVRHTPENNNAITLEVVRRSNQEPIRLVFFGFDVHTTDSLLLEFSDDESQTVSLGDMVDIGRNGDVAA